VAQSEILPDDFEVASDPGIPTIQAVLGPASMAQYLRRVLPERCASVTHIRIRILKRHRNRCTFEVDWPMGNAPRSVIAKVYGSDRADVHHAMQTIWRDGFGADAAFSIPEPLAYVPELRLLLLEKVSGPRAKQVLQTDRESDWIDAVERSAQWLARYHVSGPHLGPAYGVADVLDSVVEWSQSFDAAEYVLADRATRLREYVQSAAGALAPTRPCAGHGHYSCGQVLIADGRTVAIDWDGYDVADPCRDVACFIVDCKRVAFKIPASSVAFYQAADVFVKTYLAHGEPNAGANLPFYAAARCLRLASKDMRNDAPERAAFMLDQGLRFLEQGLSSGSEGA
jgi:hypothetical protein